MGERKEHSWQPTLLVNELYLELVRIKALPPQTGDRHNEKAAFFALAGQIMRRLLIHHARPLSSKVQKVPLWDELNASGGASLIEVEDILTRLGAIKPAIRTVVSAVSIASGRLRLVSEWGDSYADADGRVLSVSRDGKCVYYPRLDFPGANIMVAESVR